MMSADSKSSLHEDLTREDEAVGPSERSFGITFAAVFALIAAVKLWHGGTGIAWWLAGAAVMLALAFFWHAPLRPLNRLWFRLALALHSIVNPIIMGILFFLIVVPTGLLMRLVGKDPLRLRLDPGARSYWIPRTDDGTVPERMRNQF